MRKSEWKLGSVRILWLVTVYICVYLAVCYELIEETGRYPELILGLQG